MFQFCKELIDQEQTVFDDILYEALNHLKMSKHRYMMSYAQYAEENDFKRAKREIEIGLEDIIFVPKNSKKQVKEMYIVKKN